MLLKVCCIQDEAEVRLAMAAGASHVGLVGAMPSGPGPLDDDTIRRIAADAPAEITTVLLTSRVIGPEIVDHVRDTGVRAVQIVTHVGVDVRRKVRSALPDVGIVQVVHVEGPDSVDVAVGMADGADVVLLDSGQPSAPVPELGGTGRTHDWAVSAEIVRRVPVPVLLAGGLGPDNVTEAVRAVRPAGVDVCSRLRDAGGRLLAERVHTFAERVRAA